MIGERIKRARVGAGLSQRALAERAELSAMAISKFERGDATPTSTTLIRIARALGVRIEFFLRPDAGVVLEDVEYRKRSSLGAKALARIQADIIEQVERFIELIQLFPKPPIKTIAVPRGVPRQIRSLDEIEHAAAAVRDAWQLGHGAIPCLADTLEEHGFLVLTTAVDDSSKFDGLAASAGGFPLVVVGAQWPGDRQRFTMAHELGHLMLAGRLAADLDEEKACHRFAGALLAPKDTVILELGAHRNRLEPRELYGLKRKYGLSMLAWVFRARDAGVIDDSTADGLFRLFSIKRWRKKEPSEAIAPELPKLFERLVLRALAEGMVSVSKAAELMGKPLSEFRQGLGFDGIHGAADQ